jgi:hypothetical protein
MSRIKLPLLAFAILLAGCVPVSEPVGDIAKAEPDKGLLGDWQEHSSMVIDVPNVKGNPKGLMRAVNDNKPEDPANVLWFFTTTIGKRSYANIVLAPTGRFESFPFHKEGVFAEWQKEKNKLYLIVRYTIDGDKLVVDGGNARGIADLMAAEKFKQNATGPLEMPTGWFARYLDKNGPDKLYDSTNTATYTRLKK